MSFSSFSSVFLLASFFLTEKLLFSSSCLLELEVAWYCLLDINLPNVIGKLGLGKIHRLGWVKV